MDATNAGIPQPGGLLSGESSRNAAIKKLKKSEGKSSGPNTGATGLPKPGGGLVQLPGNINQSATPERKRP
jgi:hypothetical protein